MSSEPFTVPPSAQKPCLHRGQWASATLAGYGVMYCEGCGKTYFLKKAGGDLFLQEAHRIDADELESAPDEAIYAGADEDRGEQAA